MSRWSDNPELPYSPRRGGGGGDFQRIPLALTSLLSVSSSRKSLVILLRLSHGICTRLTRAGEGPAGRRGTRVTPVHHRY